MVNGFGYPFSFVPEMGYFSSEQGSRGMSNEGSFEVAAMGLFISRQRPNDSNYLQALSNPAHTHWHRHSPAGWNVGILLVGSSDPTDI